MLAKGQTVIQYVEQLAPKHVAMEDDKIGLQLGSLQKDIKCVLIALDVNEAVVDEAIKLGADLIVAHHAIIFRPLASLQTDTPMGKVYEKLIKHDIAVYIAHTNLDVTDGGMNDWMAEALGIEPGESLEDIHTDLKGRTFGLGRVGKLSNPVTLGEFVEVVKEQLDVPFVRVVGDLNRPLRKAAVVGGSGGKYWKASMFRGADVLVTGDIDYHTAQDAQMAGIALIDPGHNAEKMMKSKVAQWLEQKLSAGKYETKVHASTIDTEPFRFI